MTKNPHAAIRIAMWSGPRNISTALMRAFDNRSDCMVVDEPFYAHYLAATGVDHPGRDAILASQPTGANAVVSSLMAPLKAGNSVQYQKQMSHHITDETPLAWTNDVHNCFLLREPRAMIASYVKRRENPTFDDLGVRQLAEIYDHVSAAQDGAPIVIDSDDLLRDPPVFLRKLCDSLPIPFEDSMLAWPRGERLSDGAWAPWWYSNVEKSTGFENRAPYTGTLPAQLEVLAQQAMPYYKRLAQHKLI